MQASFSSQAFQLSCLPCNAYVKSIFSLGSYIISSGDLILSDLIPSEFFTCSGNVQGIYPEKSQEKEKSISK